METQNETPNETPRKELVPDTFLLTRPRLYTHLVINGITPEPYPNPYHPGALAWIVPLTPQTAELIATWYKGIDYPIPQTIIKYRRVYWREIEEGQGK